MEKKKYNSPLHVYSQLLLLIYFEGSWKCIASGWLPYTRFDEPWICSILFSVAKNQKSVLTIVTVSERPIANRLDSNPVLVREVPWHIVSTIACAVPGRSVTGLGLESSLHCKWIATKATPTAKTYIKLTIVLQSLTKGTKLILFFSGASVSCKTARGGEPT